jgi:hypothetical protein
MRTLNLLLLAVLPVDAWSCATCFGGDGNTDMVKAFYIGGAILLVCVFSILGTLVWYIRRSERQKAAMFKKLGLMKEGEHSDERWPL